MKKYLVLFIFSFSLFAFAQDKVKVRADLRLDQVRIRIKNKCHILKAPLNSLISVREKRTEYYEEIQFKIDTFLLIRPAIGFEYDYVSAKATTRIRMQIRMDSKVLLLLVNYGSDILSHGVSTRAMYKLHKNFLCGLQSSNDRVGPRLDLNISFKKGRNVRLGCYYFSKNDYGTSLRFDVFDFFPGIRAKAKDLEKKLKNKFNPFKAKPTP